MKKIGVISGTFDPFHIAHLELCLVTKAACELDTILLMIEKKPHRKEAVTSYEQRLNMVDLATSGYPSLRMLDVGEDNITVANTLPLLREQFPDGSFHYILGSDLVEHLKDWQDVEGLCKNFKLCVVLRTNEERSEVEKQLRVLKKEYPDLEYTVLPSVWSPVSSSKIREQIRSTGYSPYVHREVLKYIMSEAIY